MMETLYEVVVPFTPKKDVVLGELPAGLKMTHGHTGPYGVVMYFKCVSISYAKTALLTPAEFETLKTIKIWNLNEVRRRYEIYS